MIDVQKLLWKNENNKVIFKTLNQAPIIFLKTINKKEISAVLKDARARGVKI